MRKQLAGAEARLTRFTVAIKAGIDPAALVDETNRAQRDMAAALNNAAAPDASTDAQVYAMIDALGDVGAALDSRKPKGPSLV